MNANLPTILSVPEVPGVDDCDHLFTASNRRGDETLYARAQDFEWEGATLHATALTFDSDSAHACFDLTFPNYAHNLPQVAFWLIESAREQWGKGNFVLCSNTRKYRAR